MAAIADYLMAIRLTYCNIADVDIRARDEGQDIWLDLTDNQKTQLIFYATDDIQGYHKQYGQNGQLWAFQYLRNAAVSRCLFLSRVIDQRELKESNEYIGYDSQSDGVMSLSNKLDSGLDTSTKVAVDMIMRKLNVFETTWERG